MSYGLNGYYLGMYWVWWLIWLFLLVWIFIIPYGLPGRRLSRDHDLRILRRRLAKGEIDIREYEEKKALLEKNKTSRLF